MKLMIKECRKKAGLKQDEVAERLGVKPRTYGSWERGEAMLSASQLWDVCVALGCDPNTVLGWYEDHPRREPPIYADPRQAELNENFEASTPEWKNNILMTARAAAGESLKKAEPPLPALGSEAV